MRERLIELLDACGRCDKHTEEKGCVGCEYEYFEDKCVNHLRGRMADDLLANGVVILDPQKYPPVKNAKIIRTICGVSFDEAAELIDAKREGRIIVPPCRVGDTVYCIPFGNTIIECVVARITIEPIDEIGMSFHCFGGMVFDMRYIGKTVFLSRELAEEALNEKNLP